MFNVNLVYLQNIIYFFVSCIQLSCDITFLTSFLYVFNTHSWRKFESSSKTSLITFSKCIKDVIISIDKYHYRHLKKRTHEKYLHLSLFRYLSYCGLRYQETSSLHMCVSAPVHDNFDSAPRLWNDPKSSSVPSQYW